MAAHTFWVSAQQMPPLSYLGKVLCLGRERVLVYIKAKMTFSISIILTKSGRVGKFLFTLKKVPRYARFPTFSNGPVIYMPSLVPYCFKNLSHTTACQICCCLTAQQLRYLRWHEENEQFANYFLMLHLEKNNQVGPAASPAVTMAAQHHFLKDCFFQLLTFFQSVCPEIFHAECLHQTDF